MDIIMEPMNYALSPASSQGASSDPCLGELCPYINFISGNCTKYAASEQFSILLSKYFHRKQTLELTRYNYRCI